MTNWLVAHYFVVNTVAWALVLLIALVMWNREHEQVVALEEAQPETPTTPAVEDQPIPEEQNEPLDTTPINGEV